ncbi:NAD dependent epimerase-like protein 5 [Elsinoe australis]|uniref:NAD dependent epimerase-like protein 5 n=1 Tax=Elsinoe australis TaxID=40998 RepID=A0A4U7B660_9PEZI|nr:NAD dependent epimerase-like protein 5 [Elsinoe australis]
MASVQKQVFLIGPGYIGREVIDRLLENNYHVTALVRRPHPELEQAGVRTVHGTIDDTSLITLQTTKSDIIIHTATADHLPSALAVLSGIDQRATSSLPTTYIHTSGCSFLSDTSNGRFSSTEIYSDLSPAQMDARPPTSSHREIDLAIISARNRLGTKAKIFLMLPPLIYGATHHNRLSIQVITMARFALKHRYAGYVGGGKGVWGLIHVRDLSYGYMTLLKWLEESGPEVALEHPYFFCENGREVTWGEMAGVIGEELYAVGKVEGKGAREIPEEEYGDLFGRYSLVVIGQNARNRAERLRGLGWEAVHKDVREAFREEELPLLLKEDQGEYKGYAKAAASGSG